MTQDERWEEKYNEVMVFMAENHRRPSKFVDEERGMRNWWKHQQKLLNAGELKPEERRGIVNLIYWNSAESLLLAFFLFLLMV